MCSLRNGMETEVLNGVNEPAASTGVINAGTYPCFIFAPLKGGGAFEGKSAEAKLLVGTMFGMAGIAEGRESRHRNDF